MDWLDLLAVQGTLKSLLQHHSSKASILRHSVFKNRHISEAIRALKPPAVTLMARGGQQRVAELMAEAQGKGYLLLDH